ncbi:hypothetical protein ACQP2Y_20990 [Actinoplanes sp. CA-051413]|uniref:hypothetical protein n=1 Tax=Actinoplanes sp. CA-051413 TaxID=3239899 RepID=UPI003D9632B2
MSITVYGASDDLIEVDGDIREEFPYRSDEESGILAFSDGTVLRIAFDPDGSGNWRITPLAQGSAKLAIAQTAEEDDTDRANLDGEIAWVVHGIGWAKR